METQIKKDLKIVSSSNPKFIDKKELRAEQLSDPDYRLKFLENLYGSKYPISCSKCHHCR